MGTNRGGAILAIADVVAGDTNYCLSDTSTHYANDSGLLVSDVAALLEQASAVTIVDPASVAQASAVWYRFSGILNLIGGLSDRAENYAASDGTLTDPFIVLSMSTLIPDATISDAATVAQATQVWNNISGTLTLPAGLSDTAAHYATVGGALATDAAELLALDPDVTISDAAAVAQLDAVSVATAGLLNYTSIADTAANLAGYTESDGWEVSAWVAEGIDVRVSGPIDAAEFELIDSLNGDSTVTPAPSFLSAPNAYLIETPVAPARTIANLMVANLIDAPGAQQITIAAGGKLNLIGSDGRNVIVFADYALSDLEITRSGTTAIFSVAADSTQIASIATDASYAPSQTLCFSDGSYELTNDGTSLALDGVEISVVGSIV